MYLITKAENDAYTYKYKFHNITSRMQYSIIIMNISLSYVRGKLLLLFIYIRLHSWSKRIWYQHKCIHTIIYIQYNLFSNIAKTFITMFVFHIQKLHLFVLYLYFDSIWRSIFKDIQCVYHLFCVVWYFQGKYLQSNMKSIEFVKILHYH